MMSSILESEATEVGRLHGYNHANYTTAYGGDMDAVPDVPLLYHHVRSFYLSGYAEGVEQYAEEHEYDDCYDNGCGEK